MAGITGADRSKEIEAENPAVVPIAEVNLDRVIPDQLHIGVADFLRNLIDGDQSLPGSFVDAVRAGAISPKITSGIGCFVSVTPFNRDLTGVNALNADRCNLF